MWFGHLTTFFCLLGLTWCKLIPRPVARDVATTTTVAAAESTICGDIIQATQEDFVVFLASDAYQCLTSVPFNAAVATRFLDYYNTTLQFQSTLAYLENPPPGYQQPAVGVRQRLRQIQEKISAGYYKNQYAFEVDLQRLIQSLHDAHVILHAGALSVFSFASPYSITSASIDGKQTPQVYLTDDLLGAQREGWEPSPIASINGEEVIDYLTQFAALNSFGMVEPHADWNLLMQSPALDIQGYLSVFAGGTTFYPGENLMFTFENGTELSTFWLAIYNHVGPTGPLTTGGDFYNFFVLGLYPASYNPNSTTFNDTSSINQTNTNISNSTRTSWSNVGLGAYPDNPDIVQPDLSITGGGILTGYFLHDISTGVLSIPSFDQYGPHIAHFSNTIQRFIDGAKATNLSKVVIDLQQNTGGSVELVFDAFKRFFPGRNPFAGSRRRSHELANVLGGAITAYRDSLPSDNPEYRSLDVNEWAITARLNAATGSNFTSWEEYYGPVTDHGDNFSLTERYNLSSPIFDVAAFDGWIPFGDNKVNPIRTSQAWRPENIVILTDGLCSSACSVFLEMMTYQTGVHTVVIGGRPQTGPMQAASGSRGARAYSAEALDLDFKYAGVNQTANSSLPQTRDPGMHTIFAGFTLRDQVRPNDAVPLQFKYEAAECRIFHTLANVHNMSRLWRDAASATWDDASLCVEGSTGYASSGNTTAANAPPAPKVQDPALDPAMMHYTDFNIEATGELRAGPEGARPRGEIQSCQDWSCADGVSVCTSFYAKCANNEWKTVRACLPRCKPSGNGRKGCYASDTTCQSLTGLFTKETTFGISTTSPSNHAFQGSLREGSCYPTPQNPILDRFQCVTGVLQILP